MKVMIQVGEVRCGMSFRLDCKHPDDADELWKLKTASRFGNEIFRLISMKFYCVIHLMCRRTCRGRGTFQAVKLVGAALSPFLPCVSSHLTYSLQ